MGLYENIKKAAKMRNRSINQIEKDLSLPRSSIAKYNASMPSAEKILMIAQYLDVRVEYLMTGEIPSLKKPETPPDKATELYEKYLKASPEVQKAVELLLKADQ